MPQKTGNQIQEFLEYVSTGFKKTPTEILVFAVIVAGFF